MLGGNAGGGAVRSAEDHRAAHLAARHVEGLGRRIDDVVDRLHGEVPRHELDDRLQAGQRRADAEAGEAVFGDRGVDHAPGAEFLQQPLGDLVGALIFGDLLAHDEDFRVAPHLFGHGVAQRLAHRHGHHLGARRNIGIGGQRLARRGRSRRRRRNASRCGSLRHRRGGSRRGGRRIGGALALAQHARDRRVDLDVLGAFRDENLAQSTFVHRLELHGRLVGLDLGDHIARLDRVTFLLQPLGKLALFHRGRKRRHQNVNRHGLSSSGAGVARWRSGRIWLFCSRRARASRRDRQQAVPFP